MIFVFDLDGTISFSGREIAPDIIAELKKIEELGHQIVFASARPIRDLLPVLPEQLHSQSVLLQPYNTPMTVIKQVFL